MTGRIAEQRQGYKKTELGWHPEDWEVKKFEDITAQITDGTHFTPNYTKTGIPFLRVTDIKHSKIDFKTIKYISSDEHKKLTERCKPERGNILYSKNGSIGIVKIIDWDWEFSIFVSLALIKLDRNTSINKYIRYLLESPLIWKQILIRAKKGTVANLHLEEIRKFDILLPPLTEQQKIAAILSTVDEKIDAIDTEINATEKLKKALMRQLLTRGIGHTEFNETEFGWIPKEWKCKSLSYIATITMGQSPPGDTYNQNGIGVPILNGPTEFTNKYPIPIQYTTKSTKMSRQGDILFCVRGSSTGRMNLSDQSYCIGRGLASIRQKNNSNTIFIYYTLLSITQKLLSEAKGAGSTFPNISGKDLGSTQVTLPPLAEQQKIADILSTVDAKLDILKEKKETYQTLKKGLMQQLLTGALRVSGVHLNTKTGS